MREKKVGDSLVSQNGILKFFSKSHVDIQLQATVYKKIANLVTYIHNMCHDEHHTLQLTVCLVRGCQWSVS